REVVSKGWILLTRPNLSRTYSITAEVAILVSVPVLQRWNSTRNHDGLRIHGAGIVCLEGSRNGSVISASYIPHGSVRGYFWCADLRAGGPAHWHKERDSSVVSDLGPGGDLWLCFAPHDAGSLVYGRGDCDYFGRLTGSLPITLFTNDPSGTRGFILRNL